MRGENELNSSMREQSPNRESRDFEILKGKIILLNSELEPNDHHDHQSIDILQEFEDRKCP